MTDKPTYEELEQEIIELNRLQSEYRQVEENLKESEERFRLLYERAPIAYQSLDVNGNLLSVNDSWSKMLGYTEEEVLGKNFADFLHPDGKDSFKENFSRFKAVGEISGAEFEMKKKDGSYILVFFNGSRSEESSRM